MKKTILFLLVILGLSAVFSGCEKPDYQHPLHRSGNK